MKDRKSRGQQLAEDQWVHDMAQNVVVRKETQDLNDKVILYNMTAADMPELERKTLEEEIRSESDRLNPEHKWDHEEVYISQLEKKKKK